MIIAFFCNKTILPNYYAIWKENWYFFLQAGFTSYTNQFWFQLSASGTSSLEVIIKGTSNCDGSVIYATRSFYAMSPNPVSSTLNIQQASTEALFTTSLAVNSNIVTNVPEITQINIDGQSGNQKQNHAFGKVRNTQLDVSNLPNGIYYVEIITNTGNKEKHTISVKH